MRFLPTHFHDEPLLCSAVLLFIESIEFIGFVEFIGFIGFIEFGEFIGLFIFRIQLLKFRIITLAFLKVIVL